MESQVELRKAGTKTWKKLLADNPDLSETYEHMTAHAYAQGALDSKTKRLMALAVALTNRCRACILAQTERALDLGATTEEIMEACTVAISMGGTMAAGETIRVAQYLEELGKL